MSSEEEVTPYLPQPGDVFAFDACTWLMLAATPTHALCIDINDDSTHATLPLDRLTGRAVNDGATYFRERAALSAKVAEKAVMYEGWHKALNVAERGGVYHALGMVAAALKAQRKQSG